MNLNNFELQNAYIALYLSVYPSSWLRELRHKYTDDNINNFRPYMLANTCNGSTEEAKEGSIA